MLARHRVALFWVVALALWGLAAASAGARPYRLAAVGIWLPADFGRDFVAAEAQLADGLVYEPVPELGRRHLALLGLTRGGTAAGPFYAHTPAAALVVTPLVPLGFRAAAMVWLALSIVLIVTLGRALAGVLASGRSGHVALAVGAVAFVALWPPVLYNLEKGQWSLALAALMALGWCALVAERPGWAGASIGLACTLKLAPAVIFPYLLLRRPRAALAFAATVAALGVGSTVVFGIEPWRTFLRQAPANVAFWQDRLENAVSIPSLTTRLFSTGLGGLAQPLVDTPMTGRWLAALITSTLVGIALLLTWRARANVHGPLEGAVFAMWCTLGVLLNPLGWLHSSIMLLLPAALVLRAAGDPTLPLRNSARLGSAVAVVLAMTVLSLPRDTLRLLAGPMPIPPGRALAVLALPCYGAIALFAAAALVVQGGLRDRPGARGA